MEFTKILLMLIVAATVFANNSENQNNQQEEKTNNKERVNNPIEQCEKGIVKYVDCFYEDNLVTKENYNEFCEPYYKDECQTLYKDPLKSLPECKELPQETWNIYFQLIRISEASMRFYCQKDEKDQICPMVELEFINNEDIDKLKESAKATCQIPKCKESAHYLYSVLNNAIDEEEDILNEDENALKNNKIVKDIFEILNFEDCTVQKDTKISKEKKEKVKDNIIKEDL